METHVELLRSKVHGFRSLFFISGIVRINQLVLQETLLTFQWTGYVRTSVHIDNERH